MTYMKKYYEWCENSYFDEKTRKELKKIANNKSEIEDRFYKNISFGTGGLRGLLGAGTNRLNIYTVRKATQGLAYYILKNEKNKKVVISYDSRHMSKEFCEETALCLNANGIETYIFKTPHSTPELSFAIRKLNCVAGIVITASHNPPEYNGYKVYWHDGAQITFPKDQYIISEVNSVDDYLMIKELSKKKAIEMKLYHVLDDSFDDYYINVLKNNVINKDILTKYAQHICIVYTPLNGTGWRPVKRILHDLKFANVYVVEEQKNPNGNFPTLKYPNPEDPHAFDLALNLANQCCADIVLATDPDADRIGMYVRDKKTNSYKLFTGNMIGVLLAEYKLSQLKEKNCIPENGALLSTIVSSRLGKQIAKEYHISYFETLTGFKYIGEKISLFEKNKKYRFLFGYEESYGCLIGDYVRDKDGIGAVMALCEATAYYYSKGMTLWDQMLNIYHKYGYYKEDQLSFTLKGIRGKEDIENIINYFRIKTPSFIGQFKVIAVKDYTNTTLSQLPFSNVLYYELEDDAWFCVRPSGTEPKCKFYLGVKGSTMKKANEKIKKLKDTILNVVGQFHV